MKQQHLMTITEAGYGTERDLSGEIDPKYQAMTDRRIARDVARAEKQAACAAYQSEAAVSGMGREVSVTI